MSPGASRSARSEIAHVTMPRNSAWPDQDGRRRRGGQGASGRPSGRGAARTAGAGRHQEGADLPGDHRWEAVEEKALTPQSINLIEAALRRGRVGPGGGFGARFAGRVSGEAAQHGAAGDDVAAPVSLRSRATRDY